MQYLVDNQRRYFLTHATRDIAFRRRALLRLRSALREWEPRLAKALQHDLGKCPTETYMSEIGMCLASLGDTLRHLRSWSRPRRVLAPLAQFPSTCRVESEPYGVALIISPWNYPVLLSLDPLIAALSAGNCCILKPSEMAPATAAVLADMLGSVFPPEYVAVVQGGADACTELLEQHFDSIFFTGSPRIGRLVMQAAAKRLTPVTLELGGKSPCIVDATADVPLAARRIAFGKILNAGQTCVAPDYLFIHRSRKEEFISAYQKAIQEMLGDEPLQNDTYTSIVNRRHYERLMALMQGASPIVGGHGSPDTLRIEPTLLDGVTPDSPCMQEEIFGPLLPLLPYDDLREVEDYILAHPRPLACYLFTHDPETETRLMGRLLFGGGCINDTIIHLAVPGLPFGGIGNSGMGAYHGKAGFDAFSHRKSILRKATWLDLPFRYHPYDRFKETMLRIFLR